jgi:hypothetical protein
VFQSNLHKSIRSIYQVKRNKKMAALWVVGPCSLVEFCRRFKPAFCLHQGDKVIESASFSETSVIFNQSTRRNKPKDSHLHTRRRENLKSHKVRHWQFRINYEPKLNLQAGSMSYTSRNRHTQNPFIMPNFTHLINGRVLNNSLLRALYAFLDTNKTGFT